MAPFFANQSCDPFTSRWTPCNLGTYVDYAINVTDVSDISKGIAFATKHNIRLVIRNTGHELVFQLNSLPSLPHCTNLGTAIWGNLQELDPWQSGPTTSKALVSPTT